MIGVNRDIRRTALMGKIPCYTTIPGAVAAVEGIIGYRNGQITVRPLQDYFEPMVLIRSSRPGPMRA